MSLVSSAELAKLLPSSVTLHTVDSWAQGEAFVKQNRDVTELLSKVSLRAWQHGRFKRLGPEFSKAKCENPSHFLCSRFTPDVVVHYDGELAGKVARGEMPAEYAYLRSMPDDRIGLVCGFCAALLLEGWLELEAEAEANRE